MNSLQTKIPPAVVAAGFLLPLFSFAVNLFLMSTYAFASNEKAIDHLEITSGESAVSSNVSSSVSSNYLGKINKLPNRGFVKNPSTELTAKFPVCDDFLNVEWLDKENGYGYVEHDLYLEGKLLPAKKSLIYIHGKHVEHMIDLNRHLPEEFEKVIVAIKNGNKVPSSESLVPYVEYQGFRTNFFRHDYLYETYAGNHQNVCIVYPDNQRAWLVELRHVGNVFDPVDIEEKAKKVAKTFPTMTAKYLTTKGVIDVNYDGVEDYNVHQSTFFSTPSGYKLINKLGGDIDKDGEYYLFGIKGTEKICKLHKFPGTYLTTDGKNYFLSNECNLTQLSTQ